MLGETSASDTPPDPEYQGRWGVHQIEAGSQAALPGWVLVAAIYVAITYEHDTGYRRGHCKRVAFGGEPGGAIHAVSAWLPLTSSLEVLMIHKLIVLCWLVLVVTTMACSVMAARDARGQLDWKLLMRGALARSSEYTPEGRRYRLAAILVGIAAFLILTAGLFVDG
jgi:hypothetical protein